MKSHISYNDIHYNDIRLEKMPEFTNQIMGHPTTVRYSQLPEKVAVLW